MWQCEVVWTGLGWEINIETTWQKHLIKMPPTSHNRSVNQHFCRLAQIPTNEDFLQKIHKRAFSTVSTPPSVTPNVSPSVVYVRRRKSTTFSRSSHPHPRHPSSPHHPPHPLSWHPSLRWHHRGLMMTMMSLLQQLEISGQGRLKG